MVTIRGLLSPTSRCTPWAPRIEYEAAITDAEQVLDCYTAPEERGPLLVAIATFGRIVIAGFASPVLKGM